MTDDSLRPIPIFTCRLSAMQMEVIFGSSHEMCKNMICLHKMHLSHIQTYERAHTQTHTLKGMVPTGLHCYHLLCIQCANVYRVHKNMSRIRALPQNYARCERRHRMHIMHWQIIIRTNLGQKQQRQHSKSFRSWKIASRSFHEIFRTSFTMFQFGK